SSLGSPEPDCDGPAGTRRKGRDPENPASPASWGPAPAAASAPGTPLAGAAGYASGEARVPEVAEGAAPDSWRSTLVPQANDVMVKAPTNVPRAMATTLR